MRTAITFKLLLIFTLCFVAIKAYSAIVSLPNTFSDGDILTAAELNANFNVLADTVNLLDDANISSTANISPSKISAVIKGSAIERDAGSGSLSVRVDGTTIEISGDVLQLVSGGISTGQIADGAITNEKLAPTAQTPAGSVQMFHTFNGTVTIPRGWMILNGDIVNEANYDAIHGAGAYTTDNIGSSALLTKNLPDMVDRYSVGVESTTQSGAAPITSVGNAGSTINLQHDHEAGDLASLFSFNAGNDLVYRTIGASSWTSTRFLTATAVGSTGVSGLTSGIEVSGDTANSLSTSQSIEPDSIELIYIIKVI